ncbi:MAG: flippase-like domain-containing protein [Bacteroidetes bacterium]|nr:flippase-like domain-containing protein [Bacteroidota bacterium]
MNFKQLISRYFTPLVWFLKISTFLALIGICFFIDWNKLIVLGRNADLSYLILAGLLAVPNVFFSWLKWDYVVRFIHSRVKKRVTFFSMLSGMALDTVTLSPIGDYAGRLINLSEFPKASLVALQFIEKISLFFISCTGGAISFIYIGLNYTTNIVEKDLLIGIGSALLTVGLTGMIFSLIPHYFFKLLPRFKFVGAAQIESAKMAATRLDSGDTLFLLIVNILKYFTYITQFYLIVLSFGKISIGLGYMGAMATMVVRSVLSGLTLGDLGIREISSVYFFTKFGLAAEIALFSALLLFVINRLTPSLIGMVFILFTEVKPGKLTKQLRYYRVQKKRAHHAKTHHPLKQYDSAG